jgi:hypothetical protein
MRCVTQSSELKSALPMKWFPLASTWWESEHRLDVFHADIQIYGTQKEVLGGPVFENLSISPIHFMVEGT